MPTHESRIQPGIVVLSRFEIRQRVARGGFAVVWKAHDRLLGKDVALKVLQTAIADDPAAVEEMKREALRAIQNCLLRGRGKWSMISSRAELMPGVLCLWGEPIG